jgi:hypothetical protein
MLVAPPPTERYLGGLFAAARFPDPPGEGNRWECGIQYEALTCADVSGWAEVCPPGTPELKVPTLEFPLVEGEPFVALLGVQCALVGYSLQEFEQRVVNAFLVNEQRAVEQIYWTGSEGNRPRLADPDCEVLAGGEALTVLGGIAALESFLAEHYGGIGVIHAPVGVAPYLASHNQIVGTPGAPTTWRGTRWALGGGYVINTGPDGTPAPEGTAWMYATGQVNIWRSEVWTNPDDLRYAFNTKTNDGLVFAERKYIVTHECVCAAVLVTIGCDC